MAKLALVGPPGFGKTTSLFKFKDDKLGVDIKGLDPKVTVFIDVKGGGAPGYDFTKSIKAGGNYLHTLNSAKIAGAIKYVADNRPDVKHVIIDDMGYTMSFEQFQNALNKSYDAWTKLAYNHMLIYDAISYLELKRKDLHVICCYHTELNKQGLLKIKTSGNMIDNTVVLDGLFNIILYAEASKNPTTNKIEYRFRTRGDGSSSCRSPLGMFPEELIPNDAGLVVDYINKYYNIK